jgi:hypothetical protein
MSNKKSSIPETPQFQADPNVGWSQDRLKEQYNYLISGLTGVGGSLSGLLGDSVNISPEVSRLSQQYAQSQLDPAYRQQRQDLVNTLEANNQLTGSTTASALGNLSSDYMAYLTGMQAQYGLADVNRALNNRVQLYTTGLNIGQNVGSAGLENQNQMNQFALTNYENQVAASLMNQSSGSPWGAIGGGAAGAAIGTLISPGVGTLIGAGLGSSLGNAAFGGGSQSGGQIASGLSMAGGYAAGSKYAPNTNTYSSGPESVVNTTLRSDPYAQARFGGGLF